MQNDLIFRLRRKTAKVAQLCQEFPVDTSFCENFAHAAAILEIESLIGLNRDGFNTCKEYHQSAHRI